MAQGSDSLVEMFRAGLKEARKQRKSDDILDFIRNNWKLFSKSRQELESVYDELEQRGDLSVTAVAEALGLPDTLLFKKVKLVDTAKLVLQFESSSLYTLFMDQVARRTTGSRPAELCLVAVAGAHTMVVTNMPTRRVAGTVQLCKVMEDGTNDVHVFSVRDAQVRMPGLFDHKE